MPLIRLPHTAAKKISLIDWLI